MAYTLNENLKRWAEQYETADFINADPVQYNIVKIKIICTRYKQASVTIEKWSYC